MKEDQAIRGELVEKQAILACAPGDAEPPSKRTEKTEGEFARFFDRSLDLLCTAGWDGYFRHLNPAWSRRFGWTLEQLLAKPFLDFVQPQDREATLAELDALARGAETILFENRYRHLDGSYCWLQWNAWPVPGHPLFRATVRDVTRQKRLEREILEIADREKERLGGELHDGLCQTLAGISALSATLSKRLSAESESHACAASEITTLLNAAIGEARDLAHGLCPPGLNEAGLSEALEVLAGNVRHLFAVSCTFESDGPLPGIPPDVGAHLFRIVQEAVRNAVTHGHAQRIEISLSSSGLEGHLSVRDDGVGLRKEVRASGGIGLQTMTRRARLMGGSLEVRRRSRRGTALTCSFPLVEPSDRR